MTTDAPRALQADACPEAEQLAAYLDDTLRPDERTAIERHLVGCAECRDIVGAIAVAAPGATAATRSRTKWIAVGGAILAAAAAIVLAVRMRPTTGDIPELRQLARAIGTERVIEPRLSGGFAHGPAPAVVRGGNASAIPAVVALAATTLKDEVGTRPGADGDAARGVADLLLGDVDAAIASLERAAAGNRRAERFSDLSAAYLVRASRTGSQADAQRALSNADQAVALAPRLNEARFNRALALEAVDRRADAEAAWRDYLAGDPDSEWAAEARTHRERR